MSYNSLIKFKPIIGIALLFVMLGVSLLSLGIMDHGTTISHGYSDFNSEVPCSNQTDATSCLRDHFGAFQTIPAYSNQLPVILIVATALWFAVKRKLNEPDTLSWLYFKNKDFITYINSLVIKIGQWLTLHEKRDPAPTILVAMEISPVPIM